MTFRANESAKDLLDSAVHYLTQGLPVAARPAAAEYVRNLAAEHGPVVKGYPFWHPFLRAGDFRSSYIYNTPIDHNGWKGIDHDVFFARAFITCPYHDSGAVLASVSAINTILRERRSPDLISVHTVGASLYAPSAKPILVTTTMEPGEDSAITNRDALEGFMWLASVLLRRGGEVVEPWENVKEFFLGTPCGTRSSLFVSEKAGSTMRRLLAELNKSGVFGDEMAPVNRTRR